MSHTLILASQSPRRRHLLGLLGLPVIAAVSGANEDTLPGQSPAAYVADVARRKADLIAAQDSFDDTVLVIAADTTVVIDGMILGKPSSAREAFDMLSRLRNRSHLVHTGLCVMEPATGREVVETHTAVVTMRHYSNDEIWAYVATGDPLDKAGAYGIQHPLFRPVAQLDGCFLGVMGLSLCHLLTILARFNVPVPIRHAALSAAHEGYACPVLPTLLLP